MACLPSVNLMLGIEIRSMIGVSIASMGVLSLVWRGPLQREKGPQPPPRKKHPIQTTTRTTLRQIRYCTGQEDCTLRRLQQLVRSLRLLGPTILRRQERLTNEWWTEEVD